MQQCNSLCFYLPVVCFCKLLYDTVRHKAKFHCTLRLFVAASDSSLSQNEKLQTDGAVPPTLRKLRASFQRICAETSGRRKTAVSSFCVIPSCPVADQRSSTTAHCFGAVQGRGPPDTGDATALTMQERARAAATAR